MLQSNPKEQWALPTVEQQADVDRPTADPWAIHEAVTDAEMYAIPVTAEEDLWAIHEAVTDEEMFTIRMPVTAEVPAALTKQLFFEQQLKAERQARALAQQMKAQLGQERRALNSELKRLQQKKEKNALLRSRIQQMKYKLNQMDRVPRGYNLAREFELYKN